MLLYSIVFQDWLNTGKQHIWAAPELIGHLCMPGMTDEVCVGRPVAPVDGHIDLPYKEPSEEHLGDNKDGERCIGSSHSGRACPHRVRNHCMAATQNRHPRLPCSPGGGSHNITREMSGLHIMGCMQKTQTASASGYLRPPKWTLCRETPVQCP